MKPAARRCTSICASITGNPHLAQRNKPAAERPLRRRFLIVRGGVVANRLIAA